MANRNAHKNAPTSQLANLEGTGYTAETLPKLWSVSGLATNGRPKTAEELQNRINQYFKICAEEDLRPGIESLCLALHCNRVTLWEWCEGKGSGKEPQFAEICRQAKQLIISMLENANQVGKINPASGIFFLKNWSNYTDNLRIEAAPIEEKPTISLADLPILEGASAEDTDTVVISVDDLPDLNG